MKKMQLLKTGYFIDNEYLDTYLKLIAKEDTIGEDHHILQAAYFEHLGLPVDNTKTNLSKLRYAKHCEAHWLLYKCTKDFLKKANEIAFRRMIHNRVKFNIEAGISKEDYDYLQKCWNEIKNDPDTEYFSVEDEQFLVKNFKSKGAAYCAEYLNRPRHNIVTKAFKMGLRDKQIQWWTQEELDWLVQNKDKSIAECAKTLNRSKQSIVIRRRKLGLSMAPSKWTDEEINFLKANYYKLGRVECARQLNRPVGATQSKASTLCLHEKHSKAIPIYCLELNKEWPNIHKAHEELHIPANLIIRVLTGVQFQTHNLHFQYLTNKKSIAYKDNKKATYSKLKGSSQSTKKKDKVKKLKKELTPEEIEQKRLKHNEDNRRWKAAHKDRVKEYNKKQIEKKLKNSLQN